MQKFDPSPKKNYLTDQDEIGNGKLNRGPQRKKKISFSSDTPNPAHRYPQKTPSVPFFSASIDQATAQIKRPMVMHDTSFGAVCRKEVPFGGYIFLAL